MIGNSGVNFRGESVGLERDAPARKTDCQTSNCRAELYARHDRKSRRAGTKAKVKRQKAKVKKHSLPYFCLLPFTFCHH
jgi:hypothetical protein